MIMTKKYEIVLKYIKDISVEIPDAETFVFSREFITKYSLGINITTNSLKNDMIESQLSYILDPKIIKSHFEISYSTVVKIIDKNLDKNSEKFFSVMFKTKSTWSRKDINQINKNSDFPELKLDKKVDLKDFTNKE